MLNFFDGASKALSTILYQSTDGTEKRETEENVQEKTEEPEADVKQAQEVGINASLLASKFLV